MRCSCPAGNPHTRNHGELLTPARDISAHPVVLADGSTLTWKDPELEHWTLLAVPGPGCAQHCLQRLDELRRARLTLNQNAQRLRLVVLDASLSPEQLAALAPMSAGHDADALFAEIRPGTDDLAAALVDPSASTRCAIAPATTAPACARTSPA